MLEHVHLMSLSLGQFPLTFLVRLTPEVENRGWWVMEGKMPVRATVHTVCDCMAVVFMGGSLWKRSVERSQACPTSTCRRLRDAGPQQMGQMQLAALPSIRSNCAHQNCADATKPVLAACVPPGFRNNTFRTSQLAGKILSPNAKMLFPLDRFVHSSWKKEGFSDAKNCLQTVPWDSALLIPAKQRLLFKRGSTFGVLCWRMQNDVLINSDKKGNYRA